MTRARPSVQRGPAGARAAIDPHIDEVREFELEKREANVKVLKL